MTNNLKNIRDQRGIQRYTLANDTGFSLSTIYSWEKNQNNMTLDAVQKLCEYFEIEIDELINVDPGVKPPIKLKLTTTGDSLRAWRELHNLSVTDVSNYTGISTACLYKYEENSLAYTIGVCEKMCQIYNISLGQLLDFKSILTDRIKEKVTSDIQR